MYAVARGEYSDYRVMCVCPTEADAETVAMKFNHGSGRGYDAARVETIDLVTGDVERVAVLVLSTTLWDSGKESDQRERTSVEWPFDSFYGADAVSWRWVRAPIHQRKGGRLDVHGTDHELVRKVFSDRRAWLMTDGAASASGELTGGKP